MTHVAIVDYGMGNLHSVAKAIEHVAPHVDVRISADANIIRSADKVVFPGQGAMPDCMRELEQKGLRDVIIEAAHTKPFLGLCIGLQMLFEASEEGNVPGLGILPGKVVRFAATADSVWPQQLKIPHMGWNQVAQRSGHPMWKDIPQDTRFYFVHSYYVQTQDAALVAGTTDYPSPFTSACSRDNIFAVQFHPEKSQTAGLTLLRNFIEWNG